MIEIQFIVDVEPESEKAGNANCETQDIDYGEKRVPTHVAHGDEEVVTEHNDAPLSWPFSPSTEMTFIRLPLSIT